MDLRGKAMDTMLRSVAMSGYFDVTRRLDCIWFNSRYRSGSIPERWQIPMIAFPPSRAAGYWNSRLKKVSCPTFALQMAATRQKFGTGVVNVLLAHKRTLREVLLAAADFGTCSTKCWPCTSRMQEKRSPSGQELVVDPGYAYEAGDRTCGGYSRAPLERAARQLLETARRPFHPSWAR